MSPAAPKAAALGIPMEETVVKNVEVVPPIKRTVAPINP